MKNYQHQLLTFSSPRSISQQLPYCRYFIALCTFSTFSLKYYLNMLLDISNDIESSCSMSICTVSLLSHRMQVIFVALWSGCSQYFVYIEIIVSAWGILSYILVSSWCWTNRGVWLAFQKGQGAVWGLQFDRPLHLQKGIIIVLLGVKFLYPYFDMVLMQAQVAFLSEANRQFWQLDLAYLILFKSPWFSILCLYSWRFFLRSFFTILQGFYLPILLGDLSVNFLSRALFYISMVTMRLNSANGCFLIWPHDRLVQSRVARRVGCTFLIRLSCRSRWR